MNCKLREDQNTIIKEIAEKEAIHDYELEVNRACEKGDGYMGEISSVNLIGKHKKLNLILKTAEADEELRKVIVVRKAYLREIYVYNKIFPQFERFQRERGLLNCFKAFAKVYGTCDEDGKEFLVFENLKEAGYKLWDRKVPMNPDHVALVFPEYGKFHAVSLAMRVQDPETFEGLTKDLGSIFENTLSKVDFAYMIKTTLSKGFKAVRGHDGATEAFQRYSETLTPFLTEQLNLPEYNLVITHGDCWSSNMMFIYEVKFIYIIYL